ncbi:hypothetical protein [Candidatus Odyssella thessalonicensis]|uniref:hypothetical protein n=1 Tax=Candidatus Odyssella thessalonicensis TaxID=84647 RepID=UPI000225ABDA|nr:hypothetical protein [Candidatus Odyssella thessalonicensis]
MIRNSIALIWGFCEATFFFIVPDVWLSLIAINSLKKGLIACLYALAGAVLGGLLIYYWASRDASGVSYFFNRLPGIYPALQSLVYDQLQSQGIGAMLMGPLQGLPYKLFALQAAQLKVSPIIFLLVSIPARLARFFTVTCFIHVIGHFLQKYWPLETVYRIAVIGWMLFYVFYFRVI